MRSPGRPSKGPRTVVLLWLQPEVLDHTQARAVELGVGLSEYIADLLSVATGRPDLVRHVAVGDLPDVQLAAPVGSTRSAPRQRVTTRVAPPVAAVLRQQGASTSISACGADVLAQAMRRPLIGDRWPSTTSPRPFQESLLAM